MIDIYYIKFTNTIFHSVNHIKFKGGIYLKERIGIIGGGIVGSTAAYYLSRAGYTVYLYDEGTGQATKASAGIINPWFSLRRNKPWYFLVSEGAEFYHQFMADLKNDGFNDGNIFQVDGALMIRKSAKRYAKDLFQAEEKRPYSPSIGDVKTVEAEDLLPFISTGIKATYVEGGGRVDGEALITSLHQAIEHFGGNIITEKASFTYDDDIITIHSKNSEQQVDHLLLSAGAWLPELLAPHNYQTDIRPQKGQLYYFKDKRWANRHWPVVMPPGTADIIPFNDGTIIIGATHEDDQSFDLAVDTHRLQQLTEEIRLIAPDLAECPWQEAKVGTRAHTSNFDVLVGAVPQMKNVWAVSGLGSSGLTSGPYLGYQWSEFVQSGKSSIDADLFPIEKLIFKKENVSH